MGEEKVEQISLAMWIIYILLWKLIKNILEKREKKEDTVSFKEKNAENQELARVLKQWDLFEV